MFLILAHHKLFSSSDRSFLILAEEEFNGLPNDVSKSGLVSQSSLSLECVTCEACHEISIDLFHGPHALVARSNPSGTLSIRSDRTSLPSMSYTLAVSGQNCIATVCG